MKESVDIANNEYKKKQFFDLYIITHVYKLHGDVLYKLYVYEMKLCLFQDHINFTLGRQSLNLKQLDNATAAFKHLLTENSKQIPSQQNAFLREYLFVYKVNHF